MQYGDRLKRGLVEPETQIKPTRNVHKLAVGAHINCNGGLEPQNGVASGAIDAIV